MANVKDIVIEGHIPFNIFTNQNPRLVDHMASFLAPSFGLRLVYNTNGAHAEPNERGGYTTYYPFRIYGTEAVAAVWVTRLVALLRESGALYVQGTMRDVDNDDVPEQL